MWSSIGKDAVEPSFRPKAGGCTSLELRMKRNSRATDLCLRACISHTCMYVRTCTHTHTGLLPFSVRCLQIGCFLDLPSLTREMDPLSSSSPTGTVLVAHVPGRTFPHPRRRTSPVSRTQTLDAGPCRFPHCGHERGFRATSTCPSRAECPC